MIIDNLKTRIIEGKGEISQAEALELSREPGKERLYAAADEIRVAFRGNELDTCSIVNARSGRCSEDCKWCAQSAFHATGIATYPVKAPEEVLAVARENDGHRVNRFSLVTSGRRVNQREMTAFCDMYRDIKQKTGLKLCASMGLIGKEEMLMLKEAGVTRYECNLETSSSFFPALCSTHTIEEKKRTLRLAREVGLEICSGGIIGMGESMEQRLELAFELRELGVKSVPLNLLTPVKGTALESRPPLPEEEILTTIALFRFILPDAFIRFAGGRGQMSPLLQRRALRAGINASLVGGLLTTPGTEVAGDYEMFAEVGYTRPPVREAAVK
ncbi:MAG: biotin synthase BioB [Odoribacteraceae bacterium]|jgi:biotin synthase|nr:biotin synthase BioB [Odoribacteraceae bacterium]